MMTCQNDSWNRPIFSSSFFFWVWGGGYTDDNLPTYPGDNNIHIPFDYSCVDMNTSILSLAIALSAVWNRYERVT